MQINSNAIVETNKTVNMFSVGNMNFNIPHSGSHSFTYYEYFEGNLYNIVTIEPGRYKVTHAGKGSSIEFYTTTGEKQIFQINSNAEAQIIDFTNINTNKVYTSSVSIIRLMPYQILIYIY